MIFAYLKMVVNQVLDTYSARICYPYNYQGGLYEKRYGIFVACLLILITVVPVFGQATKKQLTFLFMPGVQDPFYTTMEKA